MIPLLNYVKNSHTFGNFFYRIGTTMTVKNGQIGYNESTFMPIFYAYILGFSVAIYKENWNWKFSL